MLATFVFSSNALIRGEPFIGEIGVGIVIEFGMKTCAGACDEMIPSIGFSVFVRIIEDQMKLGGDGSGGTIEN